MTDIEPPLDEDNPDNWDAFDPPSTTTKEPTITSNDETTTITYSLDPTAYGTGLHSTISTTFCGNPLDPDWMEKAIAVRKKILEFQFHELDKTANAARGRVSQVQKAGFVQVIEGGQGPVPGSAAGGSPAAGTGSQGIRQAANGAPVGPDSNGWTSVMGRGWNNAAAKPYHFIVPEVYSTEQLKAWCFQQLEDMGLDPNKFEVWDERLNAADGMSSAANVKVKREFKETKANPNNPNAGPMLRDNGTYKLVVFRAHFARSTNGPEAKVESFWQPLINLGNTPFHKGYQPPAAPAPAAPQEQGPSASQAWGDAGF